MTTIITRNSIAPGNQPTAGTVAAGELCVNTSDGTLFTSTNGTDIVSVGGGTGGGGDVPNGSTDGQMLKWTQTGSPTWAVTEAIQVTTDDNIAINGPQYSSAYSLTVNGDAVVDGDLLVNGYIDLPLGTPSLYQAVRREYVDLRYDNSVQLVGNQSVNGNKTFNSVTYLTGGCVMDDSVNINSLAEAGGTAWYVMANVSGIMRKGGVVAGAVLVQSVLTQFAAAMDATPAQMAAVQSAIAPLTVV